MVRKIAEFIYEYDRQVTVNHELCNHCSKNDNCESVCAAIEILVQLCKVKDEEKQLEYLDNISGQLDMENSCNGLPDEQ